MIKTFLSRRAVTLGVLGLFLAALTLAGCGGSAAESETEEPVGSNQAVADSETEETANTTEAEKADNEETEVSEDEATEETAAEEAAESSAEADEENLLDQAQALPEQDTTPAACHTVEIPQNPLIAQVSDVDWAKGPADAPVTVIEYGDFQ
jgi:hypothetical protein